MSNVFEPLSTLSPNGVARPDEELKEVLLGTASQVTRKVAAHLDIAGELDRDFDKILDTLEEIHRMATEEFGSIHWTDSLPFLWTKFAHKDDHKYVAVQNNKQRLEELTRMLHTARYLTKDIISTLLTIERESAEFRDARGALHVDMRGLSLNAIAERTRKSAERLQWGKRSLERIENEEGANTVNATVV